MLKEEVCGVGSTFPVSETNENTIIINIIADSTTVYAEDRSHIMIGFYFTIFLTAVYQISSDKILYTYMYMLCVLI